WCREAAAEVGTTRPPAGEVFLAVPLVAGAGRVTLVVRSDTTAAEGAAMAKAKLAGKGPDEVTQLVGRIKAGDYAAPAKVAPAEVQRIVYDLSADEMAEFLDTRGESLDTVVATYVNTAPGVSAAFMAWHARWSDIKRVARALMARHPQETEAQIAERLRQLGI